MLLTAFLQLADCAGENHGDQIARGYITVDVAIQCTGVQSALHDRPFSAPHDPINIPYFVDGGGPGGVAIVDNRLYGDLVYVDRLNNAAQGSEAVSIWADPAMFSGTDVFTFYGRFSGWDFSIYGAYTDQSARIPDLEPSTGLRAEANRFGMLGAAGNVTRGPILLKAEFAWLTNLRVLRFDVPPFIVPPNLLTVERDRLDTL